jgi:hypothetical protein
VYVYFGDRNDDDRSAQGLASGSAMANTSLPTLNVSAAKRGRNPLAEQYTALDPQADGWESETFHDRASAQLKTLATLIGQWDAIDERELAKLVASEFRCSALRPDNLREVFHDQAVRVLRPSEAGLAEEHGFDGVAGFHSALGQWLQSLGDTHKVRFESKIFRVELDAQAPAGTTLAYVTLAGWTSTCSIQQNATWRCTWSQPDKGSLPLLTTVTVVDCEQVVSTAENGRLFGDCTQAVLAANRCFRDQLCYGAAHWCNRLAARMGVYVRSLQGLAVGDVNGDGLDDLYVCEPGGLPNRLFLQNADGTARDISATSGVDLLEPTRSALIADFDNDGNQDIAVVMIYSAVAIFRGSGDGHFSLVQAWPLRGKAYSLAAADYDADGKLDLYVCGYNEVAGEIGDGGSGFPEPYYDANQGAPNVLLRNVGQLKFRDVTRDVGLDVNNRRFSYAAAWEDFDNDGDQDLYVANDFGRNNLYRNDGGRFVDVAALAAVEDVAAGMGVTWGDYDNDGLMDLYVANMWSSAGTRITYQRKFPAKDEGARALFQRLARGNTLFRNAGDGSFHDVSVGAQVTMGRWAWGTNFFDLNNDGWEDLVVANGFVTGQNPDDL